MLRETQDPLDVEIVKMAEACAKEPWPLPEAAPPAGGAPMGEDLRERRAEAAKLESVRYLWAVASGQAFFIPAPAPAAPPPGADAYPAPYRRGLKK